MQRVKLHQPAIKLLIISIVFVFQGCQKTELPKDTNDILHSLANQDSHKTLLNLEMADSLNEEFKIPLAINDFKSPPYFSRNYRNNIDSLIADSDIYSWNKKIEKYKGGVFDLKQVEGLPIYNPKTKRIINSDVTLSEFDNFAAVSIPFMNAQNDKAIIYLEYYPEPGAKISKNSFLIIMEKQNKSWREVYRKLLVVTSR